MTVSDRTRTTVTKRKATAHATHRALAADRDLMVPMTTGRSARTARTDPRTSAARRCWAPAAPQKRAISLSRSGCRTRSAPEGAAAQRDLGGDEGRADHDGEGGQDESCHGESKAPGHAPLVGPGFRVPLVIPAQGVSGPNGV